MIKEIKLNEVVSIYKTKINFENINDLISDIKLNLDISLNSKKPTPTEPGIQSPIVLSTPAITNVTSKIIKTIFNTFSLVESTPYVTYQWSYISENNNKYFGLHTHDSKSNTIFKPKWTYTYYVQMPDNLIDDDGKLVFQLEDGSVHMILPEVDDLLIFPTTLLHAPMNNTHSNKERIVLAGVWSLVDTNIDYRKKTKTLL